MLNSDVSSELIKAGVMQISRYSDSSYNPLQNKQSTIRMIQGLWAY